MRIALKSVLVVLLAASSAGARENLNGHRLILDAQGDILPWVRPRDRAFDRVMRLAWDFLLRSVPVEANGLKSYYAYCCLDPKSLQGISWPHNPAGLYAMLADSAEAYHAYSGDRSVVELAGSLLDYQLAHGTTPAGWDWEKVPYASSNHGAKEYRGAHDFLYDAKLPGRGDGYGVVEPDKIGELGAGYLKFYEMTGEARYREAAIACADALARHARAGDETHSPWPFRVYAEDGAVREEYTANVLGPVRLFDGMIRLRLGDTAAYRKAREAAWAWLMAYPMRDNLWATYFEDVSMYSRPENFNQYIPLETARYILLHPENDPDWKQTVPALLGWVEKTFVVDTGTEAAKQWGADAVSEQFHYMYKMASHTARYASVWALWHEKTGDKAALEKAFRSFAWATYMCRDNGVVNLGPVEQSVWFTDGYGDYIRHFLAGMGSVPAWAPADEDHLLRSSSVIRSVSYGKGELGYEAAGASGDEVMRLSFAPKKVTVDGKILSRRKDLAAPGWTFDKPAGVLRIRRENGRAVRIAAI
ncbi:MAG: hypothetical protein PHF00_04615 [Elusimicrobia bacterium]|nr:hypothetical protein [Elusimicrobiota bacterium]